MSRSDFPLGTELTSVALSTGTNHSFFCWLIHGCHWRRYQFWHTRAKSLKDRMKGTWKAISWSTAPVNMVSFLVVSIMLSSITMDITCNSHFSFGYRAWLNLTWTWVLTKQMARAWIYTLWLWKKEAHKILISSQGSAKVKTTACLCRDMKPISMMELSKCHKKQWGAMEHPCPVPHLADRFSNQQDLLFWSLKQQGWLGWPSCWL